MSIRNAFLLFLVLIIFKITTASADIGDNTMVTQMIRSKTHNANWRFGI